MDPEKAAMANPEQPPMSYNAQQAEPGQAYPQVYEFQSVDGGGYGAQPYIVGQQYPAKLDAVTVQPAVCLTQAPLANPVKSYMYYSFFTSICCFLPVGVAALVYSIFTSNANINGNQAEAERSSKMALKMNHISLGVGIGLIVISSIIVGLTWGSGH